MFAILILLVQPALSIVRNVSAATQPQTGVQILPTQTGSLEPGDSFTVNVSALNCTDIYAVQVDIHYDPTVLKLDGITSTSLFQFPFNLTESNIFDEMANLTYNGPTYGQILYIASRNDLLGPSGLNGDFLLFTVAFTVISYDSSSIQLIPYPGGSSTQGTYLMTPIPSPTTGYVEVIPQLYSANYGQPVSPPATLPQSASDNNGQVLSAATLPYLMPFAFAALFLLVIRRKAAGKTSNQ
jgi:hypothetical protein